MRPLDHALSAIALRAAQTAYAAASAAWSEAYAEWARCHTQEALDRYRAAETKKLFAYCRLRDAEETQ
jgi:hypothetical protein